VHRAHRRLEQRREGALQRAAARGGAELPEDGLLLVDLHRLGRQHVGERQALVADLLERERERRLALLVAPLLLGWSLPPPLATRPSHPLGHTLHPRSTTLVMNWKEQFAKETLAEGKREREEAAEFALQSKRGPSLNEKQRIAREINAFRQIECSAAKIRMN